MRRFAFKLALAVHEVDVDGMLAAIPARLLQEWAAYDSIDPFGAWRDDVRFAGLMALVANMFRGKGRVHKIEDFMPEFGEGGEGERVTRRRQQSPQQMQAILGRFAQAQNASVKRGRVRHG